MNNIKQIVEIPDNKKTVWKDDYIVNLLRRANVTLMLKKIYSN